MSPATNPLSTNHLNQHNLDSSAVDNIVVRIEVHDTGVGIRAKELIDNKLCEFLFVLWVCEGVC